MDLVNYFNNTELSISLTTLLIDNEPYFIAKEVATILGYENAKKAITDHVDELDQKMLSYDECKELFESYENTRVFEKTESFQGEQNVPPENTMKINPFGMKLINESGLYSLTFASRKPEAKAFKRWVTSEVLPCLRKTGSYSVQPTVPQTYLEALKALVASEEEKEQLRLANETLRGKLDDMGDELEIAKSEMFTNKQVFEIVRDRFTLNYADSTLKNKLSKALKSVSSELNERIFYNKVTVNDVVRTTPYYTKAVVNRLLSYIDKDCNYLKSFK